MIKYTIPNWNKYNERVDRKNYTWFKFYNGFFLDDKVRKLSPEEGYFFVYLMCERSKSESDEVSLIIDVAAAVMMMSKSDVSKYFNKLKDLNMVTALCRHDDGVMTANAGVMSSLDKIRLDKNIYSSTDVERDIENLYREKYPRKEGKTRGIKKLVSQIKTKEDLDKLRLAIDNYAKEKSGTEQKYILLFSSFATDWKDWIEAKPDNFTINTKSRKAEFGLE